MARSRASLHSLTPSGSVWFASIDASIASECAGFTAKLWPNSESRMSYVQQVLQPGEVVRFRTNVHWSIYLKALSALVIGLAFLVWFWRDDTQNMLPLL